MGKVNRPTPPRSAQRPTKGLLFCALLIGAHSLATAQTTATAASTSTSIVTATAITTDTNTYTATSTATSTVTAQATTPTEPTEPTEPTTPTEPQAYTQALQALQDRDLPRAAQLLQQVIQEHPQWAGAWLDLALLSLQQGQAAQAQELLLAMQQRFAPLPPAIAQAVQQLLQQIQQQLQPQPQQSPSDTQQASPARPREHHHILALATGYESNANAGLQRSALTLNLPEGDTLVTLDPSSRARSAHTLRTAWASAGHISQGPSRIGWQIQTQARQYSQSQLNNLELLAQASWAQTPVPGTLTLGWQNIWLSGRNAYQTPLLRWQWTAPTNPTNATNATSPSLFSSTHCTWQHHLQLEARHIPQASHLNTHWQAGRSQWRCQRGPHRAQIYGQVARETADRPTRPGGDSQHRQWGLQYEWRQAFGLSQHSLLVRIDRLHTQDSTGFSPLLDNGRPRQLTRTDLALSLSGPLSGLTGQASAPGVAHFAAPSPWHWTLSLQQTRQHSNIQYFQQSNKTVETSIWRAW